MLQLKSTATTVHAPRSDESDPRRRRSCRIRDVVDGVHNAQIQWRKSRSPRPQNSSTPGDNRRSMKPVTVSGERRIRFPPEVPWAAEAPWNYQPGSTACNGMRSAAVPRLPWTSTTQVPAARQARNRNLAWWRRRAALSRTSAPKRGAAFQLRIVSGAPRWSETLTEGGGVLSKGRREPGCAGKHGPPPRPTSGGACACPASTSRRGRPQDTDPVSAGIGARPARREKQAGLPGP